ncbi:uncharacterized protein A4U43_C06F15230 [Asparagus officinalis]|uniref:DOG1 domain-containing protein n=1 Tax=Asparagus officinalis TaxID=4686 RepID=A0A5P1EM24_ASPOF|nr:transcription factor TGA2.2-like [Asparagus officinalis]ONK67058.1 uncharacterized protein A4U43_C06F15230 [Asparagus officinalis]
MYPSHLFRSLGGNNARVADEEQTQMGFNLSDAVSDLARSPIISPRSSSNLTVATSSPLHAQFCGFAHGNVGSFEVGASSAADDCRLNFRARPQQQVDNWGDSGMLQVDDRNRNYEDDQRGAVVSRDCSVVSQEKTGNHKATRRLAQNREAARKSRLRRKAYVQQLESSRIKLAQLEQELQRARQQFITVVSVNCLGALPFDMEYARWIDEHQHQINNLRSALNSHLSDDDLRHLVDAVMSHYDEVFRLKGVGTKSDVFHMLSGMWTTPAERCFLWLGGFRSSELLKILAGQLEPLTDQQLMGICNLQQSSQQAEDALSQGMEALQQSLLDTLAAAAPRQSAGSDNVANYMDQMAVAMGKLGTLENFLRQADLLRQQTLHQMHRILTTRQAARALLAISDYFSRLRALSSLWVARPRS